MMRLQRIIAGFIVIVIAFSDAVVPAVYADLLYNGTASMAQTPKEVPYLADPPKTKTVRTTGTNDATPSVLGLADMGFSKASAAQRLPVTVQKLEKHDFSADEDVTVTVNNPEKEAIHTEVLNDEGKKVAVMVDQIDSSTKSELHISPTNQFKPGKYTVVVTDGDGHETKRDFTWGVLAFNSDKDIYAPKENAFLSMAVLDDKGKMVCDADVELRIKKQESGTEDVLSTKNGKITVNKECHSTEFTLKPDYEVNYTVGEAGLYDVKLTAKTEKGTYAITDKIRVQHVTNFVIKRTSVTRLYPPTEYPMNIEVTANRDFTGVVTETVPESFTITPANEAKSYDDMNTMYLHGKDPAIALEKKVLNDANSLLEMPFNGSYSISQGFGQPLTDLPLKEFYAHYGLAGHDGIDFALPMGTPLFSVDAGKVIFAGPGDYGITVIIQHPWGKSYYGHLSKTTVEAGFQITKGSHIGYSGNTGESTGPHLHFGIKPENADKNNGYAGKIDPMPFLPKAGRLPSTKSLSLAEQTAVLGATTSVIEPTSAVSPTASPTVSPALIKSGPTPSVKNDLPNETVASESAAPVASGAADFIVSDDQIKKEVKASENPVVERVKVLKWNVSMKKGDKITLSYQYKAPMVSPQFYTVGPLKFFDGDSEAVVFEEGRKWQIAADAIGVGWYDYYWLYRKEIIINSSKVPATQTNFPVLINLSSDAGLSAKAKTNGDDILFTDSTGKTKLSHEIESYTSGTGALIAWVKVPSVSSSSNTSIYMYYGNTAVSSQQDKVNVWDSNYKAVLHMQEAAGNVSDATTNANTAVDTGTTTTAGQIGNARTFTGAATSNLQITDNNSINFGAAVDFTLSVWMNSTQAYVNTKYPSLMWKQVQANRTGYGLGEDGGAVNNNEIKGEEWSAGGTNFFTAANYNDGTWHHIVFTRSGATLNIYNNGALVGTATGFTSDLTNSSNLYFGMDSGGANVYNGKEDEARLSNIARSATWITTEYNNQSSPSTFYSLGGEETKIYAPSLSQLMRHGKFFDSSFTKQPFMF